MSQTTTNVGRASFADPDLGYDTLDGGTALHAQLRANWTAVANHLPTRYVSATLANSASTTVTHNFGLNLAKLKVLIWESGVLRTDAQVAADYTIAESGGSSTTAIVITNVSGGSKTFIALVWGAKLGINSTDFDPACSIDTTGNIRAAELRTTGDDLVINHDAAGSGADWKATIRRQSSGMSAAAVISLPTATSTLATLGLAETLDLKTLTGCAGITLTASAPINWAAGNVALGASIGANTLTVAGASSTVRVPGTMSAGVLRTDSDDLVLNNDAASTGADWQATIRRPASGMSAAAVLTLPAVTGTLATLAGTEILTGKTLTGNTIVSFIGGSGATITAPSATGTLATLAGTEAFTNKDYDGGTASNASRLTLPKNTKTNLDALTRKQATLVYASDLNQLFYDNGSSLLPVGSGSGGGGGSAVWNPVDGSSPVQTEENGEKVYLFQDLVDAKLVLWLRVPSGYVAGTQINMDIALYSPSTSNTIKMKATTYLIRANNDATTSTTNSQTSSNSALTNTVANQLRTTTLDLTSASGQVNSVAVAGGDFLRVELTRDYANDTDVDDIRFIPNGTSVRFS